LHNDDELHHLYTLKDIRMIKPRMAFHMYRRVQKVLQDLSENLKRRDET